MTSLNKSKFLFVMGTIFRFFLLIINHQEFGLATLNRSTQNSHDSYKRFARKKNCIASLNLFIIPQSKPVAGVAMATRTE
jgi:hypothetical protein